MPVRVEPSNAQPSAEKMIAQVVGECHLDRCFTSPDGFRFVHPKPVGATLRDVHVMPNGEVWIVGDGATLLRIVRGDNGARRVSQISVPKVPTVGSIFAEIEGRPVDDDFPGSATMFLDFESLIATNANDVWIAIGERELVHWDGKQWRHKRFAEAYRGEEFMFGADGKIWTVGAIALSETQHPQVLDPGHPGEGFANGPLIPSDGHMRAIAWQGQDVWVAGFYGNLFRSRGGQAFQPMTMPHDGESYEAMWLDPEGNAGYLIGDRGLYERSGAGFVMAHENRDLEDVVSFSGGEPVFAVGRWVWRIEGGKLVELAIDEYEPKRDLISSYAAERIEAVHALTPDDVWMVGRAGMILHYDGDKLRELFPRVIEDDIEGAVWTGEDTWLASSGKGMLLSGTMGTGITSHVQAPIDDVTVVTKTLKGDILLAGCHEDILVREGTQDALTWNKVPKLEACIRGLHGTDRNNLWAVGSEEGKDGRAWHLEGGVWTEVATGMGEYDDLNAVAVAKNGDVWLAGNSALFLAKGGGKLIRIAKHPYDDYKHIAIRAPDDIWIATDANDIGSAGTLLHWNGKKLERHDKLTANYLSAVVALDSGEVWAVGLGGVATRRGPKGVFRPLDTRTDRSLDHVLAHPSGRLVVFGQYGAILEVDPPD